MTRTTTHNKLIMLLAMNIPQTTIGKNKNVIRKSYIADKQYLASPETSEGRKYLQSFTRQRSGVGSWRIIEKIAILIINCIMEDQSQNKRNSGFLIKMEFYFRNYDDIGVSDSVLKIVWEVEKVYVVIAIL